MPALYSPRWIEDFNEAVVDLDLSSIELGPSLVAESGSFSIAQEILDEDGKLAKRVVLCVGDGKITMALDPPHDEEPSEKELNVKEPNVKEPNVTVSLSESCAGSLSRGELEASEALSKGLIKVRGDLSVLIAYHALLRSTADALGLGEQNDA